MVVVKQFDRSTEQRLDALQRANRIRVTRSVVKKQTARGELPYHSLLMRGRYDPFFATMKVRDALEAMPGIGRVKALQILQKAALSPSRSMGSLLPMQWDRLYAAMEEFPVVARRLSEAKRTVPVG